MSKKKMSNTELNHVVATVLIRAEARKTLESKPDMVIDFITTAIPLIGEIDNNAHHLTQTPEFKNFVTLLAKILHCKNTFAKRRPR